MGGPGLILSRDTLVRVAPQVNYCLQNLLTSHEDVELGRCIRQFAGVTCSWSYEVHESHVCVHYDLVIKFSVCYLLIIIIHVFVKRHIAVASEVQYYSSLCNRHDWHVCFACNDGHVIGF